MSPMAFLFSASFADEMTKRLWERTIAFFISPVKLHGREREVVWIENDLTIQ
jgi:hypothetical protein